MNAEINLYIDQAPQAQQAVLKAMRDLIHQTLPDVVESFKWSRPIFSKQKDFAYLLSNKNYVTFGLNEFQKIKNPQGRLEGTGKSMRHVKLKSMEDIDPKLFAEWLRDMAE
jgi:hypothetical protein